MDEKQIGIGISAIVLLLTLLCSLSFSILTRYSSQYPSAKIETITPPQIDNGFIRFYLVFTTKDDRDNVLNWYSQQGWKFIFSREAQAFAHEKSDIFGLRFVRGIFIDSVLGKTRIIIDLSIGITP
jgi:hypothetical protein